jgi:hypothetical protein
MTSPIQLFGLEAVKRFKEKVDLILDAVINDVKKLPQLQQERQGSVEIEKAIF